MKRRASRFLTVRIVNPLVRRIAQSGLAGRSVALLETTGRKSRQKRVTPEAIQKWKADRGYDKPMMFNAEAEGIQKFTQTVFFEKSARMFAFDFGSLSSIQRMTAVPSTPKRIGFPSGTGSEPSTR